MPGATCRIFSNFKVYLKKFDFSGGGGCQNPPHPLPPTRSAHTINTKLVYRSYCDNFIVTKYNVSICYAQYRLFVGAPFQSQVLGYYRHHFEKGYSKIPTSFFKLSIFFQTGSYIRLLLFSTRDRGSSHPYNS